MCDNKRRSIAVYKKNKKKQPLSQIKRIAYLGCFTHVTIAHMQIFTSHAFGTKEIMISVKTSYF